MGDPRRFDQFARVIEAVWPDRSARIADVAGGKGYLRAALYERGYRNVTTFDKRHGKAHRPYYQYRWFSLSVKRDSFDLILGMHPDEATDVIIQVASAWRVPFAIVPCCVKPSVWPYWGSKTGLREWWQHLARKAVELGYRIEEATLPISGANYLLIGQPGTEA